MTHSKTDPAITEAQCKELETKVAFLDKVWDSIPHPFYVIDVETFRILHANKASGFDLPGAPATCHALTHGQAKPCNGSDHPCPVQQILKTGESVTVEHIHQDAQGHDRHVEVHAFPIKDETGRIHQIIEFSQDVTRRKEAEQEREQVVEELREALAHVKRLSGLLPICASCKMIRDDKGYWQQIESYISDHSEADFSHSFCPDCAEKLYGKPGAR
ncbi:MAG: PAS domain-containing protein [Deltaproteobacteria bacterium]|nr:PAS domain-containing protein [Deltaproteobacteria bacterium]